MSRVRVQRRGRKWGGLSGVRVCDGRKLTSGWIFDHDMAPMIDSLPSRRLSVTVSDMDFGRSDINSVDVEIPLASMIERFVGLCTDSLASGDLKSDDIRLFAAEFEEYARQLRAVADDAHVAPKFGDTIDI